MRREVMELLEEINKRLGLPEDEELAVESVKPGRERLYRIVVRSKTDGRVVPWSEWMRYSELRAALRLAVQVLRYTSTRL